MGLNYTGFPGDVRVAFFNIPPGNKDAVTPNYIGFWIIAENKLCDQQVYDYLHIFKDNHRAFL